MTLTNKVNFIKNYKKTFEELVKERFDVIKELTDEINRTDLIYYFKSNTFRKRFDDSNNGIELLKKSGGVKLEETKNLQNVFKTNLNEISRGKYKSEEQNSALKNIELHYESRQAVIELFNDKSSLVTEAKYKSIHGEMLKIFTPNQMLHILPTALVQVKAGSTFENILTEIKQIIYSLCRAKEINKKVYNNIMSSTNL